MPSLTDEDKVIRNDVGKRIAAAIESLSAPEAEKVSYDNTESGMTADNIQDAIDELKSDIDSVELADLDDVNLTSPQDEDELHYDSSTSKWKNIAKKIYEKSASGSLVSFNDGGDNIPLKSLIANITAVQSGSGTPSPSNPRAISGFDSGVITRCGKNLVNVRYNEFYPLHFNEDKTIIASCDYVEGTPRISFYDKNQTLIDYWGMASTYSSVPNRLARSFTYPSNAYYINFSTTIESTNYQIELGSTNTAFEEYNGIQITLPFGQTVYGGTLDVLNGVLTVTHGGVILNGAESFTEMVANKVYAYNFGFNMLGSRYDETSKCSHFARSASGGWEGIQNNEYLVASNSYFGVNPNMTLADYRTFLANQYSNGTPVTMIGTLATPVTYQLTPAQVSTLLGQNNIFADTGDISLSYFTQNANAINDIAESNTRTALNTDVPKTDLTDIFVTGTKNNTGATITKNKFFYLNGTLVVAKADISANANLTLNTNYVVATEKVLNDLYNILQTVSPTSADKLLVVQSQSQGLVPYGSKLDSANPTGTGSLSLNRASGSTKGSFSVALGSAGTASGYAACAINTGNEASGNHSFAQGVNSIASGVGACAECSSTASGNYSHSEGYQATASNVAAHAEGGSTTASGQASHSEGENTTASAYRAHAEGDGTTASGNSSHAEGTATIANHRAQHVFGQYNVADTSTATADNRGNYVEIVGKGSSDANRSNARTLDWSGNEVLAGDLTIKGNMSVYDNLNGTVTTQTVDGITWTIVKQGRVYDMFAIIPVQTTTPVMWGNLYVYRNTTSSYSLPVSLTKKISDLSFGTGNTAFWTVYYTDISTRFDSSTTADVIRPTAAGGSSVDVYKHIRGYV